MKRAFEWCLDCRWQVWGIRTQVNPWHKYINIVICVTMRSLRELPLQKCIYSGRMYRIDQKKSVLNKCCYFEHRNKYISVVPFFFSTCCSVAIHLCHSLLFIYAIPICVIGWENVCLHSAHWREVSADSPGQQCALQCQVCVCVSARVCF